MTNLPITTSTPQTAPVSKQATNTAETADVQNKQQPFGEVLARQINEPAIKDAKADDKLAVDALATLGADSTDTKKTDLVAVENPPTLPTDMLAALLPQAMVAGVIANPANTTNKVTAPDTGTASATRNAVDGIEAARASKQAGATPKADVSATSKDQITSGLPTPANPNTQIKEQPFAAALTESVDRTAGRTELKVALREAFTSASTAQPNTAALASMQSAAVSSSAATQQTVPLVINTPVSQNRWGDEFSQKITWLASSHQDQTAELHLNPPQLGPLDVVIKVSGDQATALFTSPHAAVREAIEQALPKLRDMLADNGITLGNTSVNDQTPREQDRSGTQRTPTLNGNDPGDVRLAGNSAVRVSPITRHNGIVDTFA